MSVNRIQLLVTGCGLALFGLPSSVLPIGAMPAGALEFHFTPEPGMAQEAIDGFAEAGRLWSALYSDEVTVNIDIGFRRLDPGVLGSTSSQRVVVSYADVVAALEADGGSPDDASVSDHLQAVPAFRILLNRTSNSPLGSGNAGAFLDDDGDANNTSVRLPRANAKALGLIDADDPGLDASITFSDEFNWDFDPGDGIRANHFNFVFVAAHEIGHMLGFTSGVDLLDGNSPPARPPFADSAFTWVTAGDLLRFSADSLFRGDGVIDWTADARHKYFSVDGGATDLGGYSTGRQHGDGQQASHWKDDRGLGIMDPTVAPGEASAITALDVRFFDAVGWDRQDQTPGLQADLAIAVTAGVAVTYTVTATNAGPDAVTGAVVSHVFPAAVTGIAWQCVATGGATCAASGSGAIQDVVDLPVGGAVTYTVTGTATAIASDAATITPPGGVDDGDPGNNAGSGSG